MILVLRSLVTATAISGVRNFSYKKAATKIVCKSIQSAKPEKPKRSSKPRVKWTDEQKRVISAVSGGKSVFLTGSAGTGKTALLQHLIKLLQKALGRLNVFVTASTGVAACALEGQTLHSFAGIKQTLTDADDLLERICSDKMAYKRWKRVRALVIDEISMIDGTLFDNLEFVARMIRESDDPWGGIQIVVSGDFLQLPPVAKNPKFSSREFAFEAESWESSFNIQIELRKVFRQSDSRFISLLQGVRRGRIDSSDLEFLQKSCSAQEPEPSVVRLYPRKDDVHFLNEQRLSELTGQSCYFVAEDSGYERWRKQLKSGISEDVILLVEGCRVMLIKNMNTTQGLVNGATGTVVGFVKPTDSENLAVCRSGFVPVVEFDSGMKVVVEPETWKVMDGDVVAGTRRQVPLVLAWALSVHKCQGMTLDRLHTDLSRAFGYGMVYAALSRVRSLSGLHLSGFDPSKIKAHPKVLEFYRRIDVLGDGEGGDETEKIRSKLAGSPTPKI